MRFLPAVALVAVASLSAHAQPLVLFNDNFNSENGGVSQLNYENFQQWMVTEGSVDLIGPAEGLLPPPFGMYVDLDGSTMSAGRLETRRLIPLAPGTYELLFALAGSQRPGEPDTVDFGVGTMFGGSSTLASNDPIRFLLFEFTVLTGGAGRLFFDHRGGDNVGLLLDEVRLTRLSPPRCLGDANFNGSVSFADITSVLENWEATYPGATGFGDANFNGTVNFADITSVLENWGLPCP